MSDIHWGECSSTMKAGAGWGAGGRKERSHRVYITGGWDPEQRKFPGARKIWQIDCKAEKEESRKQ